MGRLQQRLHIDEAQCGHKLSKRQHGDGLMPADVDAAEQGDVPHRRCLGIGHGVVQGVKSWKNRLRYSNGAKPVTLRKVLLKALWSLKPNIRAISAIGRRDWVSSWAAAWTREWMMNRWIVMRTNLWKSRCRCRLES